MNPVVFGSLIVLPVAAIWMTKAFLQIYINPSDSFGYSNIIPFVYGLSLAYGLIAFDVVPFSISGLLKSILPILLISLLLSFAFAAWAKSSFESKGYVMCEQTGIKDTLLIVRFERDPKDCR